LLNAVARPKADFQHVIGWLDLDQADCPLNSLAIDAEEKPGEPTKKSGRPTKLMCQVVPHSHRTSP
jgi:hypothetical protein